VVLVDGLRGVDCKDGNPEVAASRFDPDCAWRDGRDWYYSDSLRSPSGRFKGDAIQAILDAGAAGKLADLPARHGKMLSHIQDFMRLDLAEGSVDSLSNMRPTGPRFYDADPEWARARKAAGLIRPAKPTTTEPDGGVF
jgi:hypothetical protein